MFSRYRMGRNRFQRKSGPQIRPERKFSSAPKPSNDLRAAGFRAHTLTKTTHRRSGWRMGVARRSGCRSIAPQVENGGPPSHCPKMCEARWVTPLSPPGWRPASSTTGATYWEDKQPRSVIGLAMTHVGGAAVRRGARASRHFVTRIRHLGGLGPCPQHNVTADQVLRQGRSVTQASSCRIVSV